MPGWFEPSCGLVVALTIGSFALRKDFLFRVLACLTLAIAGWVGEQGCIRLYGHYRYAPAWRLFVGDVPLLVALIWPLVILSARDVAAALWPGRPAPPYVGAIVLWDASLVEVVAVAAGLWRWAEGGYLGVPVIGLLGWAYFAAACTFLIDRAAVAWAARRRALAARWLALTCVAAPLVTHAALLASWWGGLRWLLRGEAGAAGSLAAVVLGVVASGLALRIRPLRRLPLPVAAPRVLASLLFLLLLFHLGGLPRLWLHAAVVAMPYILVTSINRYWVAVPAESRPRSR